MIEKIKAKFGKNYKKIIALIIAFYCIKGTLVLLIGNYLHTKGYTHYFYGFIALILVLVVGKFLWKRRGK